MGQAYTRGQLAKLADVHGETIRYYESVGLMPDPPRTPSGHRRYAQDHLARLRFIRRARELGFEIVQTRELIAMADGAIDCTRAEKMARGNAALIKAKIRDFQAMLMALETMADRCAHEQTPGCPLVQALADAE